MRASRNDPCPCGSGEKYKKCCMHKDREKEREPAEPVQAIQERQDVDDSLLPSFDEAIQPGFGEIDPTREFWNAFWTEWGNAKYEQRLALIENVLRQHPDMVDGEALFETFVDLHEQTTVAGEQDKFNALLELAHQQAPKAYEKEAHYLLGWQIENALETNNRAIIPDLFEQLAHKAEQIDEYVRTMDRLAYHDELETLISGNRIARPLIMDEPGIMGWAVDDFADKASAYEIFGMIVNNPALASDDPILLERLDPFTEILPDRLAQHINYLTGRELPHWTIEDFEFDQSHDNSHEEENSASTNLHWLSVAFLHYAYTVENIPYVKADMACRELVQYFSDRRNGRLDPSDDLFPKPKRKRKRRKQTKEKKKKMLLPLCPERKTLDTYMSQLVGFMSSRYYTAGALFESIPAWLRFLQKYQLINADQHGEVLQELKGFDTEWSNMLEKVNADPYLLSNAKQWRENAGLNLEK